MTDTKVTTATGEWASAHQPVVVGVDGSEHNRSAVRWAADEAARAGADLILVIVVENSLAPPPLFSIKSAEKQARQLLDELAAELAGTVRPEQLMTRVVTGSAAAALIDEFPQARLLVVGKRGLGAISRMIVGSTSLAVAGRSRTPVAIVPDTWRPADPVTGPITGPVVVGVDPYRVDDLLLHLAFRRAERLDVPLVAVHGWEQPPMSAFDPSAATAIAGWEQESHAEFDRVIAPWARRFPMVELRRTHSGNHPATAVLDAAAAAQLILLGRHAGNRLTGFAFGSVTRAVLHYAECPVLVVPTIED
jgi:nucleotide-binding universal stress UspA family protein